MGFEQVAKREVTLTDHGDFYGLGLEGDEVTRCSVDYQFRLLFGETGAQAVIENEFIIDGPSGRRTYDPENWETLGPALKSVLFKTVRDLKAHKDGRLEISFEDGHSLTVDHDPDYESWNIGAGTVGEGGILIVSMPGGSLAVWSPSSFMNVNGLNVAYRRAGSGAPLVLLHGFIADSRTWRRQVDAFSRDFEVITWDAPGCGESSDPGEEFSMAKYADCLAELLVGLGAGAAHLCGLSWGGTMALEVYRRHPGLVRSLILADSYAGWTGSLGKTAAEDRLARCLRESEMTPGDWVPGWVPHAFSDGAPKEILQELASIMWGFHPVGFRAMSRACAGDFRDVLPTIRVPTLLIWGDDDKRSPLSCGEAMRDAIPGARLVVIPDAGHLSNMEQPDAFNAAVLEFLAAL